MSAERTVHSDPATLWLASGASTQLLVPPVQESFSIDVAPVEAPLIGVPEGAATATVGARSWRVPVFAGVGVLGFVMAMRLVRATLGAGRTAHGMAEILFVSGGAVWAVAAVPAALGLAGLLLYRRSQSAPEVRPRYCRSEVCFRIVSRGTQPATLRKTVLSVRRELAALPLFPYRIEVVTDVAVSLRKGRDLVQFVVPADYQTSQGARFKARALQYAIEHSDRPDTTWIMHLDEESRLTPSLVRGICCAVDEEERTGQHRIGQGAILYHRDLDRHPFLTLADMIRTGDDMGRFYLQSRIGFTLFGMHGSFILVRNDVERRVGFDFSPAGSITEDTFWAMGQMANGVRCRWVDGYLLEQSTRSVADFVKQRRRWFTGLIQVVRRAPVPARLRVPLGLFVAAWALSWLSLPYAVVNAVVGLRSPTPLTAAGDFAVAVFAVSYLLGLTVNLADRPPMPTSRRISLFLLQVVLMPVFFLMEAAGVLYAVARPERHFHVVRKS